MDGVSLVSAARVEGDAETFSNSAFGLSLTKELLLEVAQFLDDTSLLNLSVTAKLVACKIRFETGLRREIWVDSKPHGTRGR